METAHPRTIVTRFLAIAGASGMIAILIWLILNECLTTGVMLELYFLIVISMLLIAIGAHGFMEGRK